MRKELKADDILLKGGVKMELICAGDNLVEKIKHVTLHASCQGDTCDSHDGCGEQCNHAYCRY